MRENKLYKKIESQKEEEKSALERLTEELRNGIFGVFYILLKNNETSSWKYSLMMVIELIQIISYAFSSSVLSQLIICIVRRCMEVQCDNILLGRDTEHIQDNILAEETVMGYLHHNLLRVYFPDIPDHH